jgi:YidC/Oxa1 family membrane protein insertase
VGFFEVFAGALAGFYALIPSYGLAIILLTLAVRVLLLPLSIKQTHSMREMQKIQPEVKKLQAKHKGDRQKLNEEMMALYKEHGVNPFGGCAPLLLQFPVLIGLFYVVRSPLSYMGYQAPPANDALGGIFISPVEFVARNIGGFLETLQDSRLAHDLIDHAEQVYHFLGLKLHCSASGILRPPSATALDQATDASRELTLACGTGLASSLPYLVMVLLMGVTTWYQQKQMQSKQDPNNPQAAQMQMFARIMPVMLMFFAFSFPTGVVLYWLTTNVWTIAQQRIVLTTVPPPATTKAKTATATEEEPGVKAENPPKASPTRNRSKKKRR